MGKQSTAKLDCNREAREFNEPHGDVAQTQEEQFALPSKTASSEYRQHPSMRCELTDRYDPHSQC